VNELLYVAIGFAVGSFVWVPVLRFLQRELVYYRTELATAQDRLVHAHLEDRALIPPRPVETEPPKPLPPELAETVAEWESPEARQAMETKLRTMYFDRGWGVQAILKSLENEHP